MLVAQTALTLIGCASVALALVDSAPASGTDETRLVKRKLTTKQKKAAQIQKTMKSLAKDAQAETAVISSLEDQEAVLSASLSSIAQAQKATGLPYSSIRSLGKQQQGAERTLAQVQAKEVKVNAKWAADVHSLKVLASSLNALTATSTATATATAAAATSTFVRYPSTCMPVSSLKDSPKTLALGKKTTISGVELEYLPNACEHTCIADARKGKAELYGLIGDKCVCIDSKVVENKWDAYAKKHEVAQGKCDGTYGSKDGKYMSVYGLGFATVA